MPTDGNGAMTMQDSSENSIVTRSEAEGAVPEHYIFDSVLGSDELLWIYHSLINSDGWSLGRRSKAGVAMVQVPFMSFPGLVVEDSAEVNHEFFSGYFRSIVFRIRQLAKEKYKLTLPPNIRRIHIGAKSSMSRTEFHVDFKESGIWTILGFLNPVWNSSDGGEFYLKDHKLSYRSGRFVVFPSNIEHSGGYVVNETLNYWRVSLNIMLQEEEIKPT